MQCDIVLEDGAKIEDVQEVFDGQVEFNRGFAPEMEHRPLAEGNKQ